MTKKYPKLKGRAVEKIDKNGQKFLEISLWDYVPPETSEPDEKVEGEQNG